MKEIFTIGKISTTHGVKGEVKVISYSEDINRFKELKEVMIDDKTYEVENVKIQPQKVILKLKGIDDMDTAIRYKEKLIKIHRKDAIELPEDRYFVCDLIGCTLKSENGDEHGKVKDVIFTGSNDVYWAKKNGEDFLVPALEGIVLDINIEDKVILIRDLEFWM